MLIAGEASGDLHASELITSLKKNDPKAQFIFLGGDLMAQAAGVPPIIHYKKMAYMGFSEVLRNLGSISNNLTVAKETLYLFKPDCLILIDYPSFNLRVAREAKKAGIKVFYYISPKVWAWKEWRVRALKKYVDRMFVIFPFEVDFYKRHDWDVKYVGNPSVEEIDEAKKHIPDFKEFAQENGLTDRPLIALLPGSRRGEIRNNLPVMAEAASLFRTFQAVVAGAPGIDPEFYRDYTSLPVVFNENMNLLCLSRAALVTSGTATLEAALAGVPQVACYRANGSRISYHLMKAILSVKFVTLPNLIVNKEVIPEMLLHRCTSDRVATKLLELLKPNSGETRKMLAGYARLREILGRHNAADNTARAIVKELKG